MHIITYVWNLKNKTKEYIKPNTNRLTYIEYNLVIKSGDSAGAEAS